MEPRICVICKCEFKPNDKDQVKCESCIKNYPTANTLEEAKGRVDPVEQRKREMKEEIKKQIEDILMEYGILSVCDCGRKFFKHSPAQKYCNVDDCDKMRQKVDNEVETD